MNTKNNKMTLVLFLSLGSMLLGACATTPTLKMQKIVIDNSARGGELPKWVGDPKTSWEQDDNVFFKSLYSVKGNQRLNGCYDLAKLEMSETVLENIKHEIKGEIALANEGIAEEADPLITKSISKTFNGNIRGLKQIEQAYERYLVHESERIDCYLLSTMSKQDYNKLKNNSLDQVISVSDEVAKAIRQKQTNFFKSNSPTSQPEQLGPQSTNESASPKSAEPAAGPLSQVVKSN